MHIFARFLKYIKNYKFQVFLLVVFTLTESVIFVIAPKISGSAIDLLSKILSDGSGWVLSAIFEKVILLFAVYSLYALSSCMVSYLGNIIATGVTYNLREDISLKLSKISMTYMDDHSRGDILSRTVNDVEMLTDIFTHGLKHIISSVVMSVGILGMMFTISVRLTLFSVLTLFVITLISVTIVRYSKKYFKEYQETLGKINDSVSETFKGHEIIKTFGAENYVAGKFERLIEKLRDSAWKSQFISGIIGPVMDGINNINYILICILGGYLITKNSMTIGDLSAFIAYSGQINRPLGQFFGLFGMIQQTSVSATRVFELLDASEEHDEFINPYAKKDFVKSIEMKNVSFGYGESGDILKDFSLEIPKGKMVAIVGKTGSGKTTIINLLMRLYNVKSGEILIDGRNIEEVSLEDYRKFFGLVSQDVWLYGGTIMENIRYGNLSASDEDVKKAACAVGADHFIESLPNGYQTEINEDTDNISEGQRQLISLARMVISKAPILIMDEATASIDSGSEEKIQKSLQNLFSSKTVVVIAHRLSTIESADKVVLIDGGKILEQGSHSELISKHGEYFRLYMSQFSENVAV